MEKLENMTINEIPSLTWNWMKLNRDKITLEAAFSAAKAEILNADGGIKIEEGISSEAADLNFSSGVFNAKNPKLVDGHPHFDFVTEDKNHPVEALFADSKFSKTVRIAGKQEKPLLINFSKDESQANLTYIIAEENSESTVVFVYEGKASDSIFRAKILAKENAKIHIAKVQLLGKESLQLDDTSVIAKDGAEVQFTQIELGGQHVDSGLGVILQGYKSKFTSEVAYICKKDQLLDMNHIVYHTGKKSECVMNVNGTLLENAVKTYRGTIDFKNGCAGAKGNEMEEVLLLSPKAINKSIPVILCDEEDVEGEHGSTIGRLSKEVLFYMQSRGISEAEAEKIMSRAKIQAAASLIPSEEVKEKINAYLDK